MNDFQQLKQRTFATLLPVWLVFVLLGMVGVVFRFATGEKLTGYGSYVPWGLWVALYFHGIGIGGGIFFVGVVGSLLGVRDFRRRLPEIIMLSVIGMICGLFAIWVDLGHPFRMWKVFLQPSLSSMLAFNAWSYMLFFVVAGSALVLTFRRTSDDEMRDPSGWLIPLLLMGGVLSVALPSQSGAFFGVVDAKTFWHSPLMPFLFFLSSAVSGAAMLLAAFTFLEENPEQASGQPFRFLRVIVIIGTAMYMVAEFAEISLSYWSTHSHHRRVFDLILFGPFWWVFWIVHVGGTVLYLWLLFKRESLPHIGAGGLLAAFVFLTSRLNILIPAQTLPNLEGLRDAFQDDRLQFHYVASVNEYLVAFFIGALGFALSYFILQFMPVLRVELKSEENHGKKGIEIIKKAVFITGSAAWQRAIGVFQR